MHYLDHLLECPIGPSLKVLQLRRLFDWTNMAAALPQFFGAARHPCFEVSVLAYVHRFVLRFYDAIPTPPPPRLYISLLHRLYCARSLPTNSLWASTSNDVSDSLKLPAHLMLGERSLTSQPSTLMTSISTQTHMFAFINSESWCKLWSRTERLLKEFVTWYNKFLSW